MTKKHSNILKQFTSTKYFWAFSDTLLLLLKSAFEHEEEFGTEQLV